MTDVLITSLISAAALVLGAVAKTVRDRRSAKHRALISDAEAGRELRDELRKDLEGVHVELCEVRQQLVACEDGRAADRRRCDQLIAGLEFASRAQGAEIATLRTRLGSLQADIAARKGGA